jgi:hypothetical protein
MEKYYWLFSSSSQSIAAFIAFLLTGYALVLNLLESIQKNDPTLIEIHDSFRQKYFRNLIWVSAITGLAIILNLVCILLNAYSDSFIPIVKVITFLLTILSVILGLMFVISIINPNRYKNTAKKLLKDFAKEDASEEVSIDESVFIKEFIRLETKIRDYLKYKDLYVPNGKNTKMLFSVRQMILSLYDNNIINRYEYEKLIELNKYRNLIFHGHETKVYKSIMDNLDKMNKFLDDKLKI